jgi:hypothetical protein
MKINLNDVLVNSYDNNMEQRIIIYDDNDVVYSFNLVNIPNKVKHMKVERFVVASEKLTIIKVIGII